MGPSDTLLYLDIVVGCSYLTTVEVTRRERVYGSTRRGGSVGGVGQWDRDSKPPGAVSK